MGNKSGNLQLGIEVVDKNNINVNTLVDLLEMDADFSENEEYFREDTLKFGYENEAHRVAEEIYNQYREGSPGDETKQLYQMVAELTNINNYIGNGGTYEITETEFQYVIALAYIT